MAAIKMEELTFPSDCQIEPYLVNLLHRMLDKNPKTRITLEETLNHEWVTKEGVCLPQPESARAGRARVATEMSIPKVAGLRGEDKAQRAAALSTVQHFAGGGGGGGGVAGRTDLVTGNTKSAIRNSADGPAANRPGCCRQRRFTGGGGDSADGRAIPLSPGKIEATPPLMDCSGSHHSSSLSKEGSTGEGDRQRREARQRRRQLGSTTGRGGGSERGSRRGHDGGAAKLGGATEDESEEDGEAEVWGDHDDAIASPSILEEVVDKRSVPPRVSE